MPGVLVGVVLELTRFIDSLMSSSFELVLLCIELVSTGHVSCHSRHLRWRTQVNIDQKGRGFGTASGNRYFTVLYSALSDDGFGIVVR